MREYLQDPAVLSAIATIGLAFFAFVQISLEAFRRWAARKAALMRAQGPAWLARRSLEVMIREADASADTWHWKRLARDGERLDRMERQLLDVLNAAASAGGKHKRKAEASLVDFLAFADSFNEFCSLSPSGQDEYGGLVETEQDQRRAMELAARSLTRASAAVLHLEHFAPRREHEPRVPAVQALRLLRPPGAPMNVERREPGERRSLGVFASRRLFLRKFGLSEGLGFAFDAVVTLVGAIVGGAWGMVIGLLTAAFVHLGVPWVGGQIIYGRADLSLPAFGIQATGTVSGQANQQAERTEGTDWGSG